MLSSVLVKPAQNQIKCFMVNVIELFKKTKYEVFPVL